MREIVLKIYNKIIKKIYKNDKKLSLQDQNLINEVRRANLTYLTVDKLASIVETCRTLEASNTRGIFIEAGCALGGSSILIALIKDQKRPLFVHDVFGMIPPPTGKDPQNVHERYKKIIDGNSAGINGDKYYGYEDDLIGLVYANLEKFSVDCDRENVKLVKGLVQDTLNYNQPIAFAHIDVDWYEPVKTCLERIFPNLIPGGSIIFDDYHDWGGCSDAVDEYFRNSQNEVIFDDRAGSMKITKSNF